MDTDEAGEVSLEPEGTSVDTQNVVRICKMQCVIHTLRLYARV